MGNAIPRPTCHVAHQDQSNCNGDSTCYFINKRCNAKVEFYKLSDIPMSDIKCSIYPDTTKSNNYILYCINQNNVKNIIIKSIQITNCNTLYRNKCNILLQNNIQNNEFALKPYMQTFNSIDGSLTQTLNLTLEQVNLIKSNKNQITIIDVYDIEKILPVEMYDRNFESSLSIDTDIVNQNVSNLYKTKININALMA